MKVKKHYAYFFSESKQGICENWSECEKIVSGKDARYRSFKTKEEAEQWLAGGAEYDKKPLRLRLARKLQPGIYFDAGTGRGDGVEISVTDSKGKDLLKDILPKKLVNKYGKHLIKDNVTNNYGELLACRYALELALKKKTKKVFGDSKLVVDFWSRGIVNHKLLPLKTLRLAEEVSELRNKFENAGGQLVHVSGDHNPADLGFHK